MFLEIVAVFLFILSVYLLVKNIEWKLRFKQKINEWKEKDEKNIREDAIKRSARTLSGKTLEKFVPFLEDFPYDPHDVRWLGDPVDLVIFDGYSANKTSGDEIKQIVFCEIKSGNSVLSKIQSRIRHLVENKKIKWHEFRIE
jgi:predicted Holliday junction resolvase-like endonuclease